MGLETFFTWDNQILKYLVVLELYPKMYVKMAKIRLRKISYNFGAYEDIPMKIWHDNIKACSYVMWKFQVRIF